MFWCLNVNGLLVLKNGSFVYPFVGKYKGALTEKEGVKTRGR